MKPDSAPSDENKNKNPDETPKQPYTPPELTVHGDVRKITENLGVTTADGVIGSHF